MRNKNTLLIWGFALRHTTSRTTCQTIMRYLILTIISINNLYNFLSYYCVPGSSYGFTVYNIIIFMAVRISRRICPLHGTLGQHPTCRIPAKIVHEKSPELHKTSGKCNMCGECCHARIFLGYTKSQRAATVQEVRRNADLIQKTGADPEAIVGKIERTGWIPNRREIGAPDVPGELSGTNCSLLVPERFVRKTKK